MARAFNFSAGPSALPEEVLKEAAAEMLDYKGCGMSVMEMSHRSSTFQSILDDAEQTLRRLMGIPDNYRVMFMQGGATLQFACVPMNLMRGRHAGYLVAGNWSKKAWQEACKYGQADVLATSEPTGFDRTPHLEGMPDQSLDYVYLCQNETVYGTMTRELPDTGDVPIVADVSSMFLSSPLPVERYGLIYAGVQKNAGPAGNTVVICRDDLIGDGPALGDIVPTYMGYKLQASKDSLYNMRQGVPLDRGHGRPCRHGGQKLGEGQPPLWLHRRKLALLAHRAARLALNRERDVPLPHAGAGRGVCGGRRRAQHRGRQGPPHPGRHARELLQRRSGEGRGRASGLHAGVRAHARG